MIEFSSQETTVIQEWLSGSKDCLTKIVLVARWNTKIPSDSIKEAGEELDDRTGLSKSANPERDLEILQTAPLPQEQEISDIFNVRFKRSGLKQDLSFRTPTLTFTWSGYYGFISQKPIHAIRFYLKFSILKASTQQGVILSKTGFYKIKSAEPVYSTSRAEGADYEIEAVPWIYEYNDEMMFMHGDAWINQTWNIEEWDTGEHFFAYWNSVPRLQKITHDIRFLKSGNYPEGPGEYMEDAPCSYTGPFYYGSRILNQGSSGGIPSLDKYYTDPEWLNTVDLGKMVVYSQEYNTPISMFQRTMFERGQVAVSEIYKNDSPLDTPIMTFRILSDIFQDASSATITDEYIFEEIENSDSKVLYDSAYYYVETRYSMDLLSNILVFYKRFTREFSSSVSGIIEIDKMSYVDMQAPEEIGGEDYPYSIPWIVRAYDSNDSLIKETGQFYSNGDYIRILYLPGDMESSIRKLVVEAYYGKTSSRDVEVPIEWDMSGGTQVRINTNVSAYIDLLGTFWNPGYSIPYLYSNQVKKRLEFNAEFRPWINIFDLIRVKVMTPFGNYIWAKALVVDIDANVDSLSAKYEALVLAEEDINE